MTPRSTPRAGYATVRHGTEPPRGETRAEPITTPRRRFALETLGTFAYPVELRTLAAHAVAAREDVPLETIGDDARERAAIRLHHVDLPALTAAGLVEYDPESWMAVRTDAHTDDRYAGTPAGSRRSDVA